MAEQSGELTIRLKRVGRAGKANVSAVVGEDALHVDRIDAMDPAAREKFAKHVAERCPGADVQTIVAKLTDLAAGVLEQNARSRTLQTDLILQCSEGVELFHASDTAYVMVQVGGHVETHAVDGKKFKTWLCGRFYQQFESAPKSESLAEALGVLRAKALFGGSEQVVAVRVAAHGHAIVLDLADAEWRVVVIDASGWRLLDRSPIRFIRPRGLLALSVPLVGGNVGEFRELVNLPNDVDWALALAWLVAALRPTGPYPLLAVNGEQGSAKSTLCRMLRRLIDPNKADLRAEPRESRDLMIAATNGWMLGFDNLSSVRPWLSDAFCRLATGGGFATRELYSDADEHIFDAMRPILINGIETIATRSDLADRTVTLTLPTIPESARRTEAELWRKFETILPRVLGSLLDAVSNGLSRLPSVRLERLPRMADFAIWAVAAEPALGLPAGAFMQAYDGNRAVSHESAIEASVVGPPLLTLINTRGQWSGKATELLEELASDPWSSEVVRRQHDWPKRVQDLGGRLRRLAPNLRAVGIEVHPPDGNGRVGRSQWSIHKAGATCTRCTRCAPNLSTGHEYGESAAQDVYSPPHDESHVYTGCAPESALGGPENPVSAHDAQSVQTAPVLSGPVEVIEL